MQAHVHICACFLSFFLSPSLFFVFFLSTPLTWCSFSRLPPSVYIHGLTNSNCKRGIPTQTKSFWPIRTRITANYMWMILVYCANPVKFCTMCSNIVQIQFICACFLYWLLGFCLPSPSVVNVITNTRFCWCCCCHFCCGWCILCVFGSWKCLHSTLNANMITM